MINYCIIIPHYCGVGGAQLYASRRAKYLIKKGYNVYFLVVKFDDSKIGIPSDVRVLFNPYLNEHIFCIPKREREEKFNEFRLNFDNYDGLIIESFSTESATWGEYFASRMNCKHFLYSLGEPRLANFQHSYVLKFVLFKQRRGELLGVSKSSLSIILGRHFDPIRNNFVNIAFDENEIQEITKPKFLDKIDSDTFVIATVSRLAKTYVQSLIDSVVSLAEKYVDTKFNLIICGENEGKGISSIDLTNKYIVNSDTNTPKNLKFIIPGYTYPLGKDLFNSIDVFVGMGTAVVNSISQSCATICIDPRVNKSIGIFGLETDSFGYSENGEYFEIKDSIEQLLLNPDLLKKARKAGRQLFLSDYEYIACMKSIDDYLVRSSNETIYFSFVPTTLNDKLYLLIAKITRRMQKSNILTTLYKKMK